jgi:TATA-binding protein-associated factor
MRRALPAHVTAQIKAGVPLATPEGVPIEAVAADACLAMAAAVPPQVDAGDVAAAKQTLMQTAQQLQATELYLHTSVLLVLAAVVVASGRLPTKLNCVIQNLMAGLRREPLPALQELAAEALAELMVGCAARQPCPNDKLVKNLVGMACGDAADTPSAAAAAADELGCSVHEDAAAARVASHTQAGSSAAGGGSFSTQLQQQQQQQQPTPGPDNGAARARMGAEAALRAMCRRFGAAVFVQLPGLWQHMSAALAAAAGPDGGPSGDPQGLINAMQVGARGFGSGLHCAMPALRAFAGWLHRPWPRVRPPSAT